MHAFETYLVIWCRTAIFWYAAFAASGCYAPTTTYITIFVVTGWNLCCREQYNVSRSVDSHCIHRTARWPMSDRYTFKSNVLESDPTSGRPIAQQRQRLPAMRSV